MVHRTINPSGDEHSFLLLGARGTGKSTLLKNTIPNKARLLEIDLLSPGQENLFLRDPSHLERLLEPLIDQKGWVVIDEIQKVPSLLNIVHSFIEKSKLKFALTGSSARKLRTEGINLLAGRAFMYHLFPFTHQELSTQFDLQLSLEFGTLPKIFSLKTPALKKKYLNAYCETYLREEIRIEQVVKKIEPFIAFLEIAAQSNGEIVNFSKIAFDCRVDTKTVQSYFQILSDTLTGFFLKPYFGSARKRERHNPKFYLFDLGVVRALSKKLAIPLVPATSEYGRAFEHFIVAEVFRICSYAQNDYELFYWRGEKQAEVDLVIRRPGLPLVLLEIKSSQIFDPRMCSTLSRVAADFKEPTERVIIYDGKETLKHEKILIYPWKIGLKKLLKI